MTTKKTKPARTLRDSNIKATIWRNGTADSPFWSVQFTRSWKDAEGNWHDDTGFSGTDLLRLAHLAGKAYDAIAKLRATETGEGGAK